MLAEATVATKRAESQKQFAPRQKVGCDRYSNHGEGKRKEYSSKFPRCRNYKGRPIHRKVKFNGQNPVSSAGPKYLGFRSSREYKPKTNAPLNRAPWGVSKHE